MTLAEFLARDAGDPSGAPCQLIDGEAVAIAPATETHAALQGEIGRQIANHLIDKGGILSPRNEAQTRANIRAYTTIPSVREILAMHSTRIEAELLRRGPDGNWPEEPMIVKGAETLALDCIGLATSLASFYRTTALAS